MKELICLIGPSGVGKSTAGRMLEEKFGYVYFSASAYVNEIKKKIVLNYEYEYETNDLIAAISLYYKKGYNEFVTNILRDIKHEKIVWDSCVNMFNIEDVLNCFDKVYFLSMTAPYLERVKRVMNRGRYQGKSFEEVKESINYIDQYERTLGVGDLMLFSDWTINTKSIDELEMNLSDFLKKCSPTTVKEKIEMITYRFEKDDIQHINLEPLKKLFEGE